MGGVFDRLQKKLEVDKKDEGISAIDLASLPSNLRKIMKLMLREVQMTYIELCSYNNEQSGPNKMSQPELDDALRTLSQQGWLICRGEGERVNYQVNLRRKPPSKIAQGIWACLDARIAEAKVEPPAPEPSEDTP